MEVTKQADHHRFVIVNKEGMYLGRTGWLDVAAEAEVFDAAEAAEALIMVRGSAAWRISAHMPAPYAPENTRKLWNFLEHVRAAA